VVDFLHWVVYGEKARREVQYCMPHLDTCLSGFNSVWFSDNINLDDLEAVCMNSGYADCIASESVCFMMGTQYMDAIDTVCQNVIADNCVIQALECVPGEFLSPANSFAVEEQCEGYEESLSCLQNVSDACTNETEKAVVGWMLAAFVDTCSGNCEARVLECWDHYFYSDEEDKCMKLLPDFQSCMEGIMMDPHCQSNETELFDIVHLV
jgi:hypothetical protein